MSENLFSPYPLLPVLALREITAFPGCVLKIELSAPEDLNAIASAGRSEDRILLAPLRDRTKTPPYTKNDFYDYGCVATLTEKKEKSGAILITAVGASRALIVGVYEGGKAALASLVSSENDDFSSKKIKRLYKRASDAAKEFFALMPNASGELKELVFSSSTPGAFADNVANSLLYEFAHKQSVLESADVANRLEALVIALEEELPVLREEVYIHGKVRAAIEENQREFYLKEQLRVIKEELGIDEDDEETLEYLEKIKKANLPKEVEEKMIKEAGKLAKTPYASAEASVLRSYLDTLLEIPFSKSSKGQADVKKARAILEKDHYGIEKVKERILEFIAARQLNPQLKSQAICLVGPPGVGKTSVGISLAKALGREYVRVSLGGVRDEADIRGHRKTYVAAMPGRIVNALIEAKVNNPLILFDEIDKMGQDSRGDPASAMLEVLDGEQNKAFRDHFTEIPLDLSNCVFVATANSLSGVAPALIDRMEVIEMASYTAEEKVQIAKRHLIPRQRTRHGISARALQISDKALDLIISSYTHEAGVRNLERCIASICRKAARNIVENGAEKQRVTERNLSEYLGHEKVLPEKIYAAPEKGVVNGLAWTEAGGELLRVEAVSMPGNGKIECTGNLGSVMKESAQIALSCMRAGAGGLSLCEDFSKEKDIHIHFPEGATPKDGPSAGCAIYTALVSEFTGRPVRQDLAMTGEITLHGRVLPIGGLREKAMAAFKAGVHTVLIPADNEKDLQDVDKAVLENVDFVCCRSADEVISRALI